MSSWILSSSLVRAEVGSVTRPSTLPLIDALWRSSRRNTIKKVDWHLWFLYIQSSTIISLYSNTKKITHTGEIKHHAWISWRVLFKRRDKLTRSISKTWPVSRPQLEKEKKKKKSRRHNQVKLLNLALNAFQQMTITRTSVTVVMKAEGGKRTPWPGVSWGESTVEMLGSDDDMLEMMMLWRVDGGWRQGDAVRRSCCEGRLSCEGFGAVSALVTAVGFWVLEKK